jgi:integrase/recombinase XerD
VSTSQEISMKKLGLDWSIKPCVRDFKPMLVRYERYLNDMGLRASTIESYVVRVGKFLEFTQSERPPINALNEYREYLQSKKLSRSSLNNCSFAIQHYYKMVGEDVSFHFIKPNNNIPYYFDEEDILRIFSVCRNIKHYAMLQVLFYGCLRASELCNLDDCDVDLKAMTIRIREGKGGKDGMANIKDECANVLREYLQVRPPLEVDGHIPLFYTDFGQRWDRKALHRMFITYKKTAGIEKQGGVHVFSRHTPATIMVAHGCDIRIVQEVLRHNDIRTTLRYAHVSDVTKRKSYEQYLTL